MVRSVEAVHQNHNCITLALNYFKTNKEISFARECLIKMNNHGALLDMYVEFEMFEEALSLYDKISKK